MDINHKYNIHLSPEVIVSYHKGKLSPEEMHRVERHCLYCDFCSDALDGSEKADSFLKDIEDLNERIENSVADQVNVHFIRNPLIWSIAASILIVIATIFVLDLRQTNQQIARSGKEIKPLKEKPLALDYKKSEELKSPPVVPENLAKPNSDGDITKQKPSEKKEKEVFVSEEVQDNIVAEPSQPQNEIAVTDDMSEIKSVGGTGAESEGRAAPAPTASPKKSVESERSARSAQKPETKDEATLGEDKKVNAAYPLPGWEAFNKYLKQKAKEARSANNAISRGKVKVRFKINADATLSGFYVEKEACGKCSEDAIRIIKEGPEWVPGNGTEEITIEIDF